MATTTTTRYHLRGTSMKRGCSKLTLKARTDEEAMAEAALAVLMDPAVTYHLVKTISRVVGRYTPVAALVKEWEGG